MHLHLDKCFTGDWREAAAAVDAGTYEIAPIAAKMKAQRTEKDIEERALRAIKLCIQSGTTAIRGFADVGTASELKGIYALTRLKGLLKGMLDLQVVAFPQDGILRDPGTEELLFKAIEAGADVVGGIPWFEYTDEDSKRHTDIVFEIAKRYDRDVHMLVDDTDDHSAKNILYLAYKAIQEKWIGRVAASHCRGAARISK